jgi:streptogramin lyase
MMVSGRAQDGEQQRQEGPQGCADARICDPTAAKRDGAALYNAFKRARRPIARGSRLLGAWVKLCACQVEAAPMTRRAVAALGLALLALSATASAAGTPTISEYSNGLSSDAGPLSIVTGPDGNLWFTQSGGTKAIDRITPSGAITVYKPGGSSAVRDIARGPEGNLWFTADAGSGQVDMLNPWTGVFHEYSLPAGASNPAGIAAGHEGDVWFAVEGGAEAMIDRIVPTTGEISQFNVPTANGHPDEITVGPDGDLWFTENNNPGAIGRLDPNTKAFTEYWKGLTANSSPTGITTGPEGNIWFTEASNPGRIGRLNSATGTITEFSAGLTVGAPQQIVTGSDGNLYFTESNANGALGQITPTGHITEYTEGLTPKAQPWGITSGPEGDIWFTEKASPAKIGRLTVAASVTPPPTGNATQQPATPTPTLAATVALKPILGRVAVIYPISGTILVKRSPSRRFVRLSGAASVPIGSVINATHGVLRLVTALDANGRTQSATVWAGTFRVGQSRTGNGMTYLALNGEHMSCARAGRAHASSTKTRGVKNRKLWAQDEHGRYRSYGAYSATTVLGTKWETLDTCAGTLTRVVSGKVRVSDMRRHKAILVGAGHSYFAHA